MNIQCGRKQGIAVQSHRLTSTTALLHLLTFAIVLTGQVCLLRHAVASEDGLVCISPVPITSSGRTSPLNPSHTSGPYKFTVGIDRLLSVPLQTTRSIAIPNLALDEDHMVVIRQNGVRSSSFKLTFADDRAKCLWFNSLYETWSLWSLSMAKHLCDCEQ